MHDGDSSHTELDVQAGQASAVNAKILIILTINFDMDSKRFEQ